MEQTVSQKYLVLDIQPFDIFNENLVIIGSCVTVVAGKVRKLTVVHQVGPKYIGKGYVLGQFDEPPTVSMIAALKSRIILNKIGL